MPTKKTVLITLVLFVSESSFSQSVGLGSWNIINVKSDINKRWSVFAEAQLRSLKFYDHFHYHEYKAGLNFKAQPNVTFFRSRRL